jgi:hypothetical protein
MASINKKDYEGLIDWIINQRAFLVQETHELITINALRNLIFDMKSIYTGYSSKAAIELHNGRISDMTPEHFNPRQRAAEKIVAAVKAGSSKQELVEMLLNSCKIHYVTCDENRALMPLQSQEYYEAEKAYAELGIELVLHSGAKKGKKPKQIVINGIIYDSAESVAQQFDITVPTVYSRLSGKIKKWSDWSYVQEKN